MTRYEFFVRSLLGGLGVGLGLICALFIFMILTAVFSAFAKRNEKAS